ncbi:MAG: hypothetical protein SWO11_11180 [Thermodesulfobacteriota bacterium]|nr:hypothetical protein [Thermodesulfobacteriota bacterium]
MNDRQNSSHVVSIKAVVKAIISVHPRAVSLRGKKDDLIIKQITLTAHEIIPLEITPVEFSLSDKTSYDIKAIEKGKIYRITFRNKWKKRGAYRGVLQLKTNYPDKPSLKIKIYGFIQ